MLVAARNRFMIQEWQVQMFEEADVVKELVDPLPTNYVETCSSVDELGSTFSMVIGCHVRVAKACTSQQKCSFAQAHWAGGRGVH
jgi:hypothetical protein